MHFGMVAPASKPQRPVNPRPNEVPSLPVDDWSAIYHRLLRRCKVKYAAQITIAIKQDCMKPMAYASDAGVPTGCIQRAIVVVG